MTFRTKNGRTATLHPEEFLHRLLPQALPAGFVKVRHSGLFASRRVSTALPIAQRLLAARPPSDPAESPASLTALFQRLTGIDLSRCPRYNRSPLGRRVLSPHAGRAPP